MVTSDPPTPSPTTPPTPTPCHQITCWPCPEGSMRDYTATGSNGCPICACRNYPTTPGMLTNN